MQALANLLISVVELAEAEGRAAHRGVIRLLTRALMIVIAGVLAVVGIGWIGWGIYLLLHRFVGPTGAAFAYGGFLCITALILWSYGKKLPKASASNRSPDTSTQTRRPEKESCVSPTSPDSGSSKCPEQENHHDHSYAATSR